MMLITENKNYTRLNLYSLFIYNTGNKHHK